MKLPEDLFNEKEKGLLEKAKIEIDFNKDYSLDEIGELEIKLKDACLDYGFTNCIPNVSCKAWEKICDNFIDVTDKLQAVQDWLIRKEMKSGVERTIILDEKGKIMQIRKGTAENVSFDDSVSKKIFDTAKPRSLDVFHNHPSNSSLSYDDLEFMLFTRAVRSVSAVTKLGKRYTMSIPLKNRTLVGEFRKAWEKSYDNDLNKMLKKLARMLKWKYTAK